jgi:hypothetical protein
MRAGNQNYYAEIDHWNPQKTSISDIDFILWSGKFLLQFFKL